MIILLLTLLTCLFYFVAAVIFQLACGAVVWRRGEVILYGTRWGFTFWFALLWLLSFQLAWRITIHPPHPGSL